MAEPTGYAPPREPARAPRPARRRWPTAVVLVAGAVVIALTVAFGWGPYVYALGVALVVIAVVVLVGRRLRAHVAVRAVVAVLTAVVLVAVAVVVVTGLHIGRPKAWPTAPGVSALTARQNSIVYSSGAHSDLTATGVGDGRTIWSQPDSGLVALTKTAVITATETALTARDPGTGAARWTVPAAYATGVAQDGRYLITDEEVTAAPGRAQGTAVVVRSLADGHVVRRTDGVRAVMATSLSEGVNRYATALEQNAVLIVPVRADTDLTADDGWMERISDGKVLLRGLPRLVGRIVDGVLVGTDPTTDRSGLLAGFSTTTGARLWRASVDNVIDIAGTGPDLTVVQLARGVGDPIVQLNVKTGRVGTSSPPPGWLTGSGPVGQRQRSYATWVLVGRGSQIAMWRVGSAWLVPIRADRVELADSGYGGQDTLALTGVRRDVTGGRHHVAWGMTADGHLFGPFAGTSAYAGPGVVEVTGDGPDRVYPVS